MRRWRRDRVEELFRHRIFRLERHHLEADDESREALVLEAPEWINVIPVTEDDRVLLVRQWRYGIAAPTLEIPGGMVDAGEDSRRAAARELEEETGHRAGSLRHLGSIHPNPAFLSNRLSVWLATDLESLGTQPANGVLGVEGEEIRLERAPLAEIPELIASGEISHALVIAAFYLLGIDGPVRR